jgi:hypothetical protein
MMLSSGDAKKLRRHPEALAAPAASLEGWTTSSCFPPRKGADEVLCFASAELRSLSSINFTEQSHGATAVF